MLSPINNYYRAKFRFGPAGGRFEFEVDFCRSGLIPAGGEEFGGGEDPAGNLIAVAMSIAHGMACRWPDSWQDPELVSVVTQPTDPKIVIGGTDA